MAQEDGRILGTRPREEGKETRRGRAKWATRSPSADRLAGDMFQGGQSGAAGKTKLRERKLGEVKGE